MDLVRQVALNETARAAGAAFVSASKFDLQQPWQPWPILSRVLWVEKGGRITILPRFTMTAFDQKDILRYPKIKSIR